MRLFRVFPWAPAATAGSAGHPLWIPRWFQGAGRHDAPDHYGCLYLSESPAAAVAETLAPFRGSGDLHPSMLVRSGEPLALAELELADAAELIDFDEPAVLAAEALRPSVIATGNRTITQRYAVDQFTRHPNAAGMRWWSTLEASWLQVTLFDRALARLRVHAADWLAMSSSAVTSAAGWLGLA